MENQRKKEYMETVENLKQEKIQLDNHLTQIKSQLSKEQSEPARLKRQTDMVRNALNTMKLELQSVEKKLVECDNLIAEKQKQKDIDSKELLELGEAIDVARTNHEQKGQQIDELINQIRDEDIKSGQLCEEKVKFDLENERIKSDKSEILQQETIQNREYRLVRKELKHMSDNVDQLKSTIPILEGRLVGLHHDIKTNNETLARETKALASLETEIEINISQFLNQEKFEADQKQVLTLMRTQKEEMERQIDMWNEETKKMSRTLKILNNQKEFKSREASQASLNEKNTRELLKIKELTIIDLTKKSNDLNKKLKQFSLLYDVIKTERNKLVNMLQSSAQAISELKEKLRILTNEINILKNENGSKDRSLNNERMEHEHSKYERDNLKTETNKHYNIYNTKQSKIDQQVMEIDKLNSIINKIEREMLKLKRNYELGVELRNYYGVQLIDRNDELCIFYEKSNIQEATLRKGNDALNKLDEDKKVLLVHFQEVCRQIDLVRKHIPEVPALLEKIEELRNTLKDEKESIRELCEQLENPSNLSRWRPLEGEDLTKDQLEAKLNLLQSRLDQKKKQVLDKQLVLEEITSLSEKLKLQAQEGRQEALHYANKIHDVQCEIRDITASLLASVAELSMYKSMCIKLEEERDIIREIVDNTIMVIDQGNEPSNDLLSSFYKNENNQILDRDRIENMKRLQLKNEIDLNRLHTTAEPRPNSYVPDDLPLPKPYGGFAPFKPSVTGTNMRHIKKPKPPNIEI